MKVLFWVKDGDQPNDVIWVDLPPSFDCDTCKEKTKQLIQYYSALEMLILTKNVQTIK
jgi:hypothetical protein